MQTKSLILLASAALAVAQSAPPGSDLIRIQTVTRPACIGAQQASPGASVISTPCGSSSTTWVVSQISGPKQIMLSGTNLCIAPDGSGAAPLRLVTCSPQDPLQRFAFNANGAIVGQNNVCMAPPNQDGPPIIVIRCNGSIPQRWTVSRA